METKIETLVFAKEVFLSLIVFEVETCNNSRAGP